MKKLLHIKDAEEFWEIVSEEKERQRKKLARLPFVRKIAILEQMQADGKLLRSAVKEKIAIPDDPNRDAGAKVPKE